jgi:hypothetical protein
VRLKFVVRRGALRRFDRLKRATGDLPVDVIWDRRRTNVPTDHQQGHRERRREPVFTWTAADFVIVEDDEDAR